MPSGMTAKDFMRKFINEMTVDGNYLPCERKNSKFTRNVNNAIQRIISDTPEYYTVDHTEFLYDEEEEIYCAVNAEDMCDAINMIVKLLCN